jgi:emp24/gp25L/p24 family/GOLD
MYFRHVAESTNSRVLWFSILSMVVLVVLGIAQITYLKRFFQAKKLI